MPDRTPDEQGLAPSGAMAELANDPSSRKRFLKMMGTAGGASAFSVFLAACGSSKSSTSPGSSSPPPGSTPSPSTPSPGGSSGGMGDIKIVNYALTLEYLEADFYAKVAASGLFKGAQLTALKKIGANEQQHVSALTAAVKQLGGTPAAKPQTKFPLKSATSVAMLAATVENLGAAAYLGQAGNIQSKQILAAALSIHSVEARHAAFLNTLVGKSVTPEGAFAKPATMEEVLPKVKPFIVG